MPKSRLLATYSSQRRWTREEARAVLTALSASRLSVSEFAARQGLGPQRLYFWKRIAHLTPKRPRSETLERLERWMLLPRPGLIVAGASKPRRKARQQPSERRRSPDAGGRGTFPAHIERVPVPNVFLRTSGAVPLRPGDEDGRPFDVRELQRYNATTSFRLESSSSSGSTKRSHARRTRPVGR